MAFLVGKECPGNPKQTGVSSEPGALRDAGSNRESRQVRVRVKGIVQGVGFRPFIYQLAHHHGLNGWVRNDSDGVEIEVSGPAPKIEQFLDGISAKAPPLARIVQMQTIEMPFAPLDRFSIHKSQSDSARQTLIAPDVCTCDDCLRELSDPRNRRYRYPFINCTNCGPRYTIIRDIPYDRDKTTMAGFAMCPSCRKEYEDPMNRRFHAQPNACWECGPQVWLESADGHKMAQRDEALGEVVRLLEAGSIVAIKGLGGFHLAACATSEASVSRLRKRKVREEKPFAVMFFGLDSIARHCRIGPDEAALLQSGQRPIVLLQKRENSTDPPIAPSVAPHNRFLGAFLPYTPLHYLLFEGGPFQALVMTSGNQSDEPMAMENAAARDRLRDIADFFLFHDRDIYMRCDDSVTRVLHQKSRPLRRARGYVPVPVFLRAPAPAILGVGAELKNSVCLTRGNEAFLSQHIGDLENLETLRSFELTISHLQRILEIEPQCIVHDLHPDYLSTQWALAQKDIPCLAVQHHHAHIAAVVAEQKVSGAVLGLALDGTGYGTDGTIWGGEILRVEEECFERLGHIRHVALPGGNKAIREPWRMALSYLWSLEPSDPQRAFGDFLKRWPRDKVTVLLQMLERGINTPLTSSCGRLFDAVAALAGIRDAVNYEGQAAIELEQALQMEDGKYQAKMRKEQGTWILDPLPMVAEVIRDVRNKTAPGVISARFHNGLIFLLVEAALAASAETGIQRIALSGGVFQNAYLFEQLEARLKSEGFEVYAHVEVPTNDACIALGQAYIGAQWLKAERSSVQKVKR